MSASISLWAICRYMPIYRHPEFESVTIPVCVPCVCVQGFLVCSSMSLLLPRSPPVSLLLCSLACCQGYSLNHTHLLSSLYKLHWPSNTKGFTRWPPTSDVIYIKPQSSNIVDATPVFPSIVDVMFEDTKAFQWRLRLASSLVDQVNQVVSAAGIPWASALSVTETVPLSSMFPVKAVTILCVWATYCSIPDQVRSTLVVVCSTVGIFGPICSAVVVFGSVCYTLVLF